MVAPTYNSTVTTDEPGVGTAGYPAPAGGHLAQLNANFTALALAVAHLNAPVANGNSGATPAPNVANGLNQQYTQNSNVTWGAPTGTASINVGAKLVLLVQHDGTGGSYTTAFNAIYRNAPAIAASAAANSKATFEFIWDGTSWQYVGGSTAFA